MKSIKSSSIKKWVISRSVNGITINTQREYLFHPDDTPLLAPDANPMLFKSAGLALKYCEDNDIDIESETIDIVLYE